MFRNLILRDIKLAYYTSTNFIFSVSFFILIMILMPFVFGINILDLKFIFEGLIWIGITLALLLTLDSIFSSDFNDGNLDIILGLKMSFETIALAKVISVWIINCLPIIFVMPIIGFIFGFSIDEILPINFNLFLGSIGMTATAVVASSLTLGLKRMIYLKSIIIIPLYIPFIIFGVDTGSWLIVLSLSMISLVFLIFIVPYSLRLYGE